MKQLLCVLFVIPLFFCKAHAQEPAPNAMDIFDTESMQSGLSEEEAEIGGELSYGTYDVSAAMTRLWRSVLEKLRAEVHAGLGFAAVLLALVFLCAFACAVCTEDRIRDAIEICGTCTAAVMLTGSMNSLVSQTVGAIYRLSDYSKAALPVLYTAAAAAGAVSSSAVRYAAASLALDVMMSLAQKAVIPLIYAYLALGLSSSVFPNPLLEAMEQLSRWAAKTVLTASTIAFTACLSLSSLVSTSVDAAAVKTARTVISTTLPVVGGMLSDASAAVLAAAGVVRSCTGAFGLIAVSAMCAGPIALLSVKSFLFKAVAAAADSVQNARLKKLFSCLGSALGLLMGLLGCNAIMLFLSFAAGMKAVTV